MVKVFGIFVFIIFMNYSNGQTKNNAESLYQTLFSTYNRQIIPKSDLSKPLVINLEFHLQKINQVDEIEETLTTTGFLYITWRDENLIWIPNNYGEIYYMYVSQDDVWKPDVVLANGNSRIKALGGSSYYVPIYYMGTVSWYPYEVFTTLCSIDMTYYPFDTQTCHINFTIWSYRKESVEMTQNPGFTVTPKGNSIWTLISSSVSVLNTDAGLIVSYELVLKRKPAFYIVNIILPIIILGFITTVVFIIPADAGEKIGFAVTVFLSFAVFLTIVSDQLPTNSENTAFVSVYIIIEVFLSVFALIVSAIQLRLHHRSATKINKVYRCLVRFALFLRCKTCCSCRRNKSEPVEELKRPDDEKKKGDKLFVSAFGKDEEEEEEEEFTWSDVSNALDVVGFFFFSFTNIAVTVAIFLVLIM